MIPERLDCLATIFLDGQEGVQCRRARGPDGWCHAHRAAKAAADDLTLIVQERPEPQAIWWVLEWPQGLRNGGETGWWRGRDSTGDRFSWDIHKAVRFVTKADAELIKRVALINEAVIPTDHLWMESRRGRALDPSALQGNPPMTVSQQEDGR